MNASHIDANHSAASSITNVSQCTLTQTI